MVIGLLSLGWIFLVLFLISGYFFNTLSDGPREFKLSPITWENHMHVFNGAIQCSFIGDDLMERKKVLKKELFSEVQKREETTEGIIYYFKDDAHLLESVMEHVQIEKRCCPFFQFDISILPFNQGFALKISSSEEALKMMKNFEKEDI